MNLRILFFLTFITSFITGCATIVSGTTQQVTFQSTPEGATVKLNGRPLGKTPLTIQLDREDGQILTIEKEGYKTFSTSMDTRLEPWFWGNIITGGLIGSTTDGMSGAINEYSPGQYIVTLESEQLTQAGQPLHMAEHDRIKRFLFLNYTKLRSELSVGSGEVVDATLDILKIPQDKQLSVTNDIKIIMFKTSDAEGFVNSTLEQFFDHTQA